MCVPKARHTRFNAMPGYITFHDSCSPTHIAMVDKHVTSTLKWLLLVLV